MKLNHLFAWVVVDAAGNEDILVSSAKVPMIATSRCEIEPFAAEAVEIATRMELMVKVVSFRRTDLDS